MGLYYKYIFPRVMDFLLSRPHLAPYREKLLHKAKGDILEIGIGTGLNLLHYPPHVKKITAVDTNDGMSSLLQGKVKRSGIKVDYHPLNCEELPFPNHSFDTVVSSLTLCSIANTSKALQEIFRVLKPGGQFLFFEHGLSPQPCIRFLQNLLTPLQKVIADGCHLNRDIKMIITDSPFKKINAENTIIAHSPKIVAYAYQGAAMKAH